jgi:hypothetical protein
MKSLFREIGRAIAAAIELVVTFIDGVINVTRRVLGVPASMPNPEVEAEAILDRVSDDAGERQVGDRWDPDSVVSRTLACVASTGLNNLRWPGMHGIPNNLQSWLVSLTREQSLALLRASRDAQEAHIAGKRLIAGVPEVPKAGATSFVVPEPVKQRGVSPTIFFGDPAYADMRAVYAKAARQLAVGARDVAEKARATRLRRAAEVIEIEPEPTLRYGVN